MEIDWVTFTLEIVNFLILVWILQRFLYKPILRTIERRRAAIEKTLTDANAMRAQAEEMESRYRDRLAVWEEEKARLRTQTEGEIATERTRRMAALQQALAEEREKHEALTQHRAEEERRHVQQEALAQGAEFAARLLQRLAAPELEKHLLQMVLEDLPQHTDAIVKETGGTSGSDTLEVKIASAFPLASAERGRLEDGLRAAVGSRCSTVFEVDPKLLAGLRITVGPWILRANLQDELRFFSEGSSRVD